MNDFSCYDSELEDIANSLGNLKEFAEANC